MLGIGRETLQRKFIACGLITKYRVKGLSSARFDKAQVEKLVLHAKNEEK